MTSFFENKRNILIIGGIILLVGVGFFLYKKINKTNSNIKDLHNMVVQQQQAISNQGQILNDLQMILNYQPSPQLFQSQIHPPSQIQPQQTEEYLPTVEVVSQRKNRPSTPLIKQIKVKNDIPIIKEVIEEEDEKEEEVENLDAELEEELKELEENDDLKEEEEIKEVNESE